MFRSATSSCLFAGSHSTALKPASEQRLTNLWMFPDFEVCIIQVVFLSLISHKKATSPELFIPDLLSIAHKGYLVSRRSAYPGRNGNAKALAYG